MEILKMATFLTGGISALCWLRASNVTVDQKGLKKIRDKIAKKTGTKPDYTSVSLIRNGKSYDLIETLQKQSVWNSMGAAFAAVAVILSLLNDYLGLN